MSHDELQSSVMKEIWLVTEGEYSAYTVLAACTTEEEARAVAHRIDVIEGREGRCRVSAIPVVTAAEIRPAVEGRVSAAWIPPERWMREGDGVPHERPGRYDWDAEPNECTLRWGWILERDDPVSGGSSTHVWCRSGDPEVALKIARDEFARLKAERAGLT